MFDSKRFLNDYSIQYWTEGKNCSPGRVQIKCCMCDDTSNHLGLPLNGDTVPNCWRCGSHSIIKIIKNLLNVSWSEAKEISKEYSQNKSEKVINDKYSKKKRFNKENDSVNLPKNSEEIKSIHKKYLIKRGFNPDTLEKLWKIKGTGNLGQYKYRIVIPIIVNGIAVSFQARDISGKAELRYKACKIEDEIIHHKFIAYGTDYIKNRKAIIVEGILDAWKLGPGAIATFGTGFKKEQILFISNLIDEAFILYDSEKEAQEKAEKLCFLLSDCGVKCEIITQNEYDDPGEMPVSEAESLRLQILGY